MIKTYEALLATALMMGTLALISSPYFIPEEKYEDLRDAGEAAFLSFVEEGEFRNLAVAVNDNNSLAELENYIGAYYSNPYTLRVCDVNDNCWGSIPTDQAFTLISYLFDGNITNHSIKKIQMFTWIFKVR